MIKSFRHKGLEKFYLTGSTAGIQPVHASLLRRQLFVFSKAKNGQIFITHHIWAKSSGIILAA
ncbi:MAG: hypothetical protein G5663_00040 [Serratia symbiotica]|nr:hypothetical protein [Serratia symbiotica]